jgi:glucosyl-3-phosphoglycerate synthase
MRSNGFPLNDDFINMIWHTYYENGLKFVKIYSDDAEVNGMVFDRYQEEMTVGYFRDFLWSAWEEIKGCFIGTQIPSWNRVLFSVPDIYRHTLEAVERDNA